MSRKTGWPPLKHEATDYDYCDDLAPAIRAKAVSQWWRHGIVLLMWCAVAFLAGIAAFSVVTTIIAAVACE